MKSTLDCSHRRELIKISGINDKFCQPEATLSFERCLKLKKRYEVFENIHLVRFKLMYLSE